MSVETGSSLFGVNRLAAKRDSYGAPDPARRRRRRKRRASGRRSRIHTRFAGFDRTHNRLDPDPHSLARKRSRTDCAAAGWCVSMAGRRSRRRHRLRHDTRHVRSSRSGSCRSRDHGIYRGGDPRSPHLPPSSHPPRQRRGIRRHAAQRVSLRLPGYRHCGLHQSLRRLVSFPTRYRQRLPGVTNGPVLVAGKCRRNVGPGSAGRLFRSGTRIAAIARRLDRNDCVRGFRGPGAVAAVFSASRNSELRRRGGTGGSRRCLSRRCRSPRSRRQCRDTGRLPSALRHSTAR